MKKIRIMLALVLALMLLTSAFLFSEAETAPQQNWQADIQKLIDPADVPQTTHIHYENSYDEGVTVSTHEIACEVTVNGIAYGCEFIFEIAGGEVSDWTPVQEWLGGIVVESARTAGSDSETLANAIDRAISAARKNTVPDAGGQLPLWASEQISVSDIRVSTPFYPELSIDKNGEATQRLQVRLIELGFLSGKADGYFGAKTKAAVEALENYVRELEQDLIDEYVLTLMPEPTVQVASAPTNVPKMIELSQDHVLNLVPKNTQAPVETEIPAAPAATPMGEMEQVSDLYHFEPVTPVDGVADALLQAYLYSDSFVPFRRTLGMGDSGSDVTRLQTRLSALGLMVGAADGSYGGSTARSVRIFQYYNGLEQTGVADAPTLARLYSGAANAPENPMLAFGSKGDEVRALQTRLRELGFGTGSSDGDYGASTQRAVETLQQYMRNREEALRAQAVSTGSAEEDVTKFLTVEVNGIADPILLEQFYDESFPMYPATLKSGSSGDDVIRVQRRLKALEYLFGTLDGSYGGQTAEAVRMFQKQHKLEQTGVADFATLKVLFSGDAQKALKQYVVKVSTADQRVYVYGLDNNNQHTVLVRTMKCSTGKDETPTPKGTYQATTGPGARWHYFKKFECWAQYAYYIQGDIMFHSVLYNEQNGPVTQSSVNNLGRKASHGCVRLSVEDAKWLWNNCPAGTKVVVY